MPAPVAPPVRRDRNRRGGRSRPRHERDDRARRLHAQHTQLEAVTPAAPPGSVKKVLLLSAADPGEIRVAIIENGDLAEIFLERKSHVQQTGNIYKGRVVNVEPSLQAAFVDLGLERNGFLHASDCIPPDGGYADLLKSKDARKTKPEEEPADEAGEGEAPAEAQAAEEGVASDQAPANGAGRKRRRRRRGGRRRTARARAKPSSAPMIAPDAGPSEPASEEVLDFGPGSQDEGAAESANLGPESDEPGPKLPEKDSPSETHSGGVGELHLPVDLPAQVSPAEVWPTGEEAAQPPGPARPDGPQAAKASPESETAPELSVQTAPVEGIEEVEVVPKPGPKDADERRGRGRGRGTERRMLIQEMLKRGADTLVQVAKEGLGQKGPALTTYLSIPGRYLVLMPALDRLGVSKRIENDEQRRQLKEILADLKVPEGMGVIVRTAGMGRSKEELQRDLGLLVQKWEAIKKKAQVAKAPALLFQEGDVITRVFRDVLSDDVSEILVDDPVVLERAKEFLREMSPGTEARLKLYADAQPMFHKLGVERQIQQLFNRKVSLRGGGSIVIEQTEALVAIDVNTGRYRDKRTQDESILATNLEAAREIARQLRLRDIGGLVMVDFIDMDIHEHRRRVEREFKQHLARDKARINVMPISPLGIVEMTRQRIRHSLRRALFERCPHCHGLGQVKTPETLGLEVLRELRALVLDAGVTRVRVSLHSGAACAIHNRLRRDLVRFEESRGVAIELAEDPRVMASQFQIAVTKNGHDWSIKKISEVDDYVRNS